MNTMNNVNNGNNVNNVNNGMRTVSATSLWQGDSLHPDTFVLDVRTPAEFREAHIPGSRNMPLEDIRHRALSVLGRASTLRIAIVCGTGRRAASACQELRKSGVLSDLHVLDGGIVSWRAAGLPIKQGRHAVSLERQVRIAAGSLIVLGVLLGYFLHPGFFGLAAFVGAGLVLAGISDTCGMALILSKMPWNRAPLSCQTAACREE